MKDLVLIPASALGALETAHQKDCHAHRNHNGQDTYVRCEPMGYGLHSSVKAPEGDQILSAKPDC
jgi:hypothetical protein